MHHEVWFAEGGAGDHEKYVISTSMGFAGEDAETTPKGLAVPAGHVVAHDPGLRAAGPPRVDDAHAVVRRARDR